MIPSNFTIKILTIRSLLCALGTKALILNLNSSTISPNCNEQSTTTQIEANHHIMIVIIYAKLAHMYTCT